jgi:hypothetical protein
MSKGTSAGRCQFCSQVLPRAVMARHLSSCGQPETSASSTGPSFHLLVEARHAKAYWMHVALPVNAPLSKLDKFLRKTWLECCGHLSSFEIAGERYASDPMGVESSMKRPLQHAVDVGMSFSYEYDYGSTTELKLKVAGVRPGGTPKGAAQLLARNEFPSILCQSCGTEPAAEICVVCACDEVGWLCLACTDGHSCEEEMRLPVTNSPRAGVCAYSG